MQAANTYWTSYGSVRIVGTVEAAKFIKKVRADLKKWGADVAHIETPALRVKHAAKKFQDLVCSFF